MIKYIKIYIIASANYCGKTAFLIFFFFFFFFFFDRCITVIVSEQKLTSTASMELGSLWS